jgi:hypothetical protein
VEAGSIIDNYKYAGKDFVGPDEDLLILFKK